MYKPIVTFILTSYKEVNDWMVSIGSLLCQTNPNWMCIVVQDERNATLEANLRTLNDNRIVYVETEKSRGFWAHGNRVDMLKLVDTSYIINSSIQDYHLPTLVQHIANNQQYDIIYWDSINHLCSPKYLICKLGIGNTDWDNFSVRTTLAKSVGINNPKSATADGEFMQDLLKTNPTRVKINEVLVCHN